jgi:hypothetical protein
MTAPSSSPKVLFAVIVAVVVGLNGCSTSAPSQTKFMQSKDISVSAEELRIKVRALAAPFSGIMEEVADEFIQTYNEPEWIRLALLWKINGIPAMQRSLFVQDPLAALLDTWVLLAQMRDYFVTGPGSDAERVGRAFALGAIDRMEEQIEQLALSISADGNVDDVRDLVYEVAAETAIDTSFATRPATSAELAKFTAEAEPGIGTAVGALTTSLGDVWSRMDVYTAFLPKQARWQAELMVLDIAGDTDPGDVFDHIASLTESIDRIAATVETAPELVADEREIILQVLQQERMIALQAFHDELTTAYKFISRERIAAISESLAAEREATLEALTRERIATLQAIHEERVAAMADLDSIVGGLSEDALTRLVDRLFVRILLLLVVMAIGAAVVARIVVRGRTGG